MDTSIEVEDGEKVLKFKNFLVEEVENEISVSQNFIYEFSVHVGEGYSLERSKSVIALIIGEIPDPTVTGNKNRVNLIWAPYISTVQLSRRIDRGEANYFSQLQNFNRAGVK